MHCNSRCRAMASYAMRLILLFIPLSLAAADLRPWFPEMLQPQTRLTYGYDWAGRRDLHLFQGAFILSPWPTVSSELELALAAEGGIFFDFGRPTLCYLIWG